MPLQEPTLVIFTQGRIVAGKMTSGGERLLELLGSGSSDFLRLRDASVHTTRGTDLPLPSAVIRKEFVSMAIPVDERRDGIEKVYFAYKKKKQYDVVAVVDGFTVRGTIHLQTAGDELTVMSRELAAFVPVTNAEIWGANEGQASTHEPIVILNSRRMALLHVGDERHD